MDINSTMLAKLIIYFVDVVCVFVVLLTVLVFLIRRYYFQNKKPVKMINGKEVKIIGFFHPYANSCGGGEKVLWCAVQALQEIAEFESIHCVIYTGDTVSKEEILETTRRILHIDIKPSFSIEFVRLRSRTWLEAFHYPHFTMIFQSLASMWVVFEGLCQVVPDLFVDTTGLAFTYPIVKIFTSSKVMSYTHYPTISTDMLQRVRDRVTQYNNDPHISNNVVLSVGKQIYYYIFSIFYSLAGRCADLVMVNGTWTYNHILNLWRQPHKVSIVYPPCDTTEHRQLGLFSLRQRVILSLGQFRPEKDHLKQLHILRKLIDLDARFADVRLVMIGGCRNAEDEERVNGLKRIAEDLDLTQSVVFLVNASYEVVQQYLASSLVGLHTMRDEHFGISVVEFMAAGLLTVAHNSAGPKEDIVIPCYPKGEQYALEALETMEKRPVGFLASSVEEYVEALEFIFSHEEELAEVAANARERSLMFSTERFVKRFKEKLISMLNCCDC